MGYNKERIRKNKEISRQKAREFVASYLATHPCTDCGESDPIVLTFDHLPEREKKRANISQMVRYGLGLETIKAEMEKCDVVCFNCHMRRERKKRSLACF